MYRFVATDGSQVSCVVEGEGMDSGDKASNKAMAVAHKYALLQVLMIPTEEQKDPDAEVHELGQVSGEPVDATKVANAVEYIRATIDADIEDEERAIKLANARARLTNDEMLKVDEGLRDKAPGTNRMYKTIFNEYLKG